MIIIGVDFRPEFQQTASVDTDTGECTEKRLAHSPSFAKIQADDLVPSPLAEAGNTAFAS